MNYVRTKRNNYEYLNNTTDNINMRVINILIISVCMCDNIIMHAHRSGGFDLIKISVIFIINCCWQTTEQHSLSLSALVIMDKIYFEDIMP